ncbi:COG1470 family protein [Arthrobacter sp. MMS24-S77]
MPSIPELFRSPLRTVRAGAKVLVAGLLLVIFTSGVVLAASSNGNGNQNTPKGITLQLAPASRSATQGTSASYNVVVQPSGGFSGNVSLSASGLPAGATASFSPASVAVGPGSASATLDVSTTSATPLGTYSLSLKGTSGTLQSAVVVVSLTVTAGQHQPFTISGGPTGLLAPGNAVSINLQLANPGNSSLNVTGLTVSITGVTRTAQAVAKNLPCTPSDYAVTQFSGSYPFSAPPGNSSLSGSGIPAAQWPQIKMLNSSLNQDGCKGATLQLSYSGTGQGN